MRVHRSLCAVAGALPVGAALTLGAPAARALDDCGVGMDYDYQTQQCEPWAPVTVGNIYNPGIPVPIPNFNVAPDLGVGVGVGVGLGVDGVLPRVDPVDPALRGVDAPLHGAPIHDAPIHGGPHVAPIHGSGHR